MNIHTTRSYTFTTTGDVVDGGTVDLEDLSDAVSLLESQSTVQATIPQNGLRLQVMAAPGKATVAVTGGTLPSGTRLEGVLSLVSATP